MKKFLLNSLLTIVALSWIIFSIHNFIPQLAGETLERFLSSVSPTLARLGIVDILLVAWLWIVAYLIGRTFLGVLGIECIPGAERLSLSTAAGLLLVSLLAFLSAAIRMLHDLVAFGLLVVPTIIFWRELRVVAGRTWPVVRQMRLPARISMRTLAHFFLLLYAGTALAIVLISALGPEIEYDAMAYHLPAAKAMVEARGFMSLPDIPLTFFPKNIEVLFALGMILHSEITAKLVHYLFGLLTLIAV